MTETEAKTEKIVIIATHGGEDPERATFPFVAANAALTMDVKVTVILMGTAVTLAQTGVNDHIFATGLPPLKDLMGSFLSLGGQLLVCTPCIQGRKITPEMLLKGSTIIAAARLVQECLEAKATLSY